MTAEEGFGSSSVIRADDVRSTSANPRNGSRASSLKPPGSTPPNSFKRSSSLVSENNSIDVSWFARQGLMSKESFKVYKKELKHQKRATLVQDTRGGTAPLDTESVREITSTPSDDSSVDSSYGSYPPQRIIPTRGPQANRRNKTGNTPDGKGRADDQKTSTDTSKPLKSSVVSANCGLNPSWYAKRGLMSKNTYRVYEEEHEQQRRAAWEDETREKGESKLNCANFIGSGYEEDVGDLAGDRDDFHRNTLNEVPTDILPTVDVSSRRVSDVSTLGMGGSSLRRILADACGESESDKDSDMQDDSDTMVTARNRFSNLSKGLNSSLTTIESEGNCSKSRLLGPNDEPTAMAEEAKERGQKSSIGVSNRKTLELPKRGFLPKEISSLTMGGFDNSSSDDIDSSENSDRIDSFSTANEVGTRVTRRSSMGTIESGDDSSEVVMSQIPDGESVSSGSSTARKNIKHLAQHIKRSKTEYSQQKPGRNLVSQNSGIDPSWFASRGLMSKGSLKKYKKETKAQNSFLRDKCSAMETFPSIREGKGRNENVPVITGMGQHMERSKSRQSKQKTIRSFVRSCSNDPGSSHQISRPYHRSVSLDDGIERITEFFVDALAKSSDSEKRTAFANLSLRLSQTTQEAQTDNEYFKGEEILSSDVVAPQCSESTPQLTDSNSSSLNSDRNRINVDDCQPKTISIEPQDRISDLSCLDSHKAVMNTMRVESVCVQGTSDELRGLTDIQVENAPSIPNYSSRVITNITRDESVCVEDLSDAQRLELHSIQVEDAPSTSTGKCEFSHSSQRACDHSKDNDDSASIDPSLDTMTSDQRNQLSNIQDTDSSAFKEASIEVKSNSKPYTHNHSLHLIPSGDESDKNDDSVDAAFSISKDAVLTDTDPPSQDECPRRELTLKPSLLDDGIKYLSMSMLALQYRKLREMSLLGHVSVKLRDIDVNSYQLISRLKELKRRGLLTPEEEKKGFLDRSLTAEFIVRTVLDECQMFNESTDLLSLNPIDQTTAEYDAR